jgi:hypothetical protein
LLDGGDDDDARIRVGCVEEAPVVFFSMATSSGEDVSRDVGFLFSRNRLNVAISRAQCLAILSARPGFSRRAATRSAT